MRRMAMASSGMKAGGFGRGELLFAGSFFALKRWVKSMGSRRAGALGFEGRKLTLQ